MNSVSAEQKNLSRTVFLVFVVVIMSQVNIHIFTGDFKVTIAAIVIPLFVYLIERISIIQLTFVSAFAILGARILVHLILTGGTDLEIYSYLPETVFYCTYGLLLVIYDNAADHNYNLKYFIPAVALIDYFCNSLELSIRIHMAAFKPDAQFVIIAVAVSRAVILWVILEVFGQYRLTLLSRAHAERYQRLLILMSRLSGEVLWMKKNIARIESTMSTSYGLYDNLQEQGNPAAEDALTVAKDIHEVKKEYYLIMRGLSEALEEEVNEDGMAVEEIYTILINAVNDEFADAGKKITVTVSSADRLYTKESYLFLSVFHNLMTNAVEASKEAEVKMSIEEQRRGDDYVFVFHDEGPGIADKYRDSIFRPRFSTKIDYETGVVNRGLGLPIVKGIVEENLHGTISLLPCEKGTSFEITIPAEELTEAEQ
ncbi:MAG: ATP-binding protein [Eubacteriaceae bacterium]|jgi:two-component system sensor histidine kinase YcbA|nr:ATP-binding protein [Eubacteriaceae bacterium]